MSVTPAPVLVDLRSHRWPELLAAFVDLYRRTFTDPSEREDPAEWPPRLYDELPPPQPRMHILIALADGAAAEPLAGVAFEYYRDSRCGLLTYLVTAPAQRRRGLAHRLVLRAIELLHADAREQGAELRAVFAETEDPQRVPAAADAMSPHERLRALGRLGARRLDLPYVQPRLAGANAPCRHLLLLAFYPGAARTATIDGAVMRAFLSEFYRALGVTQPDTDADFRHMVANLADAVPLSTLA